MKIYSKGAVTAGAFLICLLCTGRIFCMSNGSVANFLEKNSEIFVNNSVFAGAIRYMGWEVTRLLVWVSDSCSSLYDIAFGFVDFTSWSKVNQLTSSFKPLFIALMAASVFALGIILILNHEKKPRILIGICIAVLCVTCSTNVFQQLNQITADLKMGIENVSRDADDSRHSEVYSIIDNNMVDLVVLSRKFGGLQKLNYSAGGSRAKYVNPGINEDNFAFIDYNETLNPRSDQYTWNDSETDILSKKLYVKGSSVRAVRDIYNGFGFNSTDDADLCNEFYYRYHFSFVLAWMQLVSLIVIYLAMSYKCVRIAYELVIARLLAYLYSANLSAGEKIGKVLIFIRDSYILLLVTTLCIRVYGIFCIFIQGKVDSGFAQGVLILFAAFCVIDGPNLVEKLIGMDAGLTSSTARFMAAYGAVKGATKLAAAPGRFAADYGIRRHEQTRMTKAMNRAAGTNEARKRTDEKTGSTAFATGDAKASRMQENPAKYEAKRGDYSFMDRNAGSGMDRNIDRNIDRNTDRKRGDNFGSNRYNYGSNRKSQQGNEKHRSI